jgi:hypothetical protein
MNINLKDTNLIGRRTLRAAMVVATAAMIALSGCASEEAANKLQTQLHFDLSQCQQTGTNVYKCPSVDKSICGAFYAGPQVDCLYLDKDGNVIVQRHQ